MKFKCVSCGCIANVKKILRASKDELSYDFVKNLCGIYGGRDYPACVKHIDGRRSR